MISRVLLLVALGLVPLAAWAGMKINVALREKRLDRQRRDTARIVERVEKLT
jgi:hypothetical protein